MNDELSDRQPHNTVERIRPEGAAVSYNRLNSSQKQAIRRLLYTMEEAANNLSSDVENARSFRPNNVIFISGKRGSGKTCLLHTFMKYTDSHNSSYDIMELDEFNKESTSIRRGPALQCVQQSVEWLPSIDIDPLPADFDLVSSVLVRIRSLIEKRPTYRRPYDTQENHFSDNSLEDIDLMYESLLVDAAQAWKGGMIGAENSQEPEIFAMVAKSLAEANLNFSSRFRNF